METATVAPAAPASSSSASAPSSGGSSASTSATPAASPSSSGTEGSSRPQTTRELSREAAKKIADQMGIGDTPSDGDTSAATSETQEKGVGSQADQPVDTPEAKADKADEASPKDPQSMKLSEALKAIPDKKLQNEIRGLTYTGKEFRDLKMTPAEGKELRSMYPTLDVAKQAHESARIAYDVAQAFNSGTPEGFDHVLNSFAQANPAAADNLVRYIAEKLPQANKAAYDNLGRRTTSAVIGNLERAAQDAAGRGDDARAHEFATTAQILKEFVFPNGFNPPAPRQNDPVARELAALRAERSQFQNQQRQGLIQSIESGYKQALASDAEKAIKEAADGSPYPEKAIKRMAEQVAERVRSKVQANQHVNIAVIGHINQGNGQAALSYLSQAAGQYIPSEVASVLNDYAEEFGVINEARLKKQEQVVAKKDIGGASVAAAPGEKPPDTRGMSGKQLLRAALKARGLNL